MATLGEISAQGDVNAHLLFLRIGYEQLDLYICTCISTELIAV